MAGRDPGATAAFATALRALKARTPHSYETLAGRTGISRSALHRYCAGTAVPTEFAVVERFATRCGADRTELVALHRLWVLATEPLPDAADAGTGAETGAAPTAGTDAGAGPAPDAGAAAPVNSPPRRARWRRRGLVAGAVALAVAAAVAVATLRAPWAEDEPLLLSAGCRGTIGMGQQDECVREVERLLAAAGAEVDGLHGRYVSDTRRHVLAFQALAGVRTNGVVDGPTKRALHQAEVSLTTWDRDRVRARIRAVFTENPEQAVALADCQSMLDPHYVMSNADSTRTWGLFQLSETRLDSLGATPAQALDPEWNIRAAHRIWSRHQDFRAWPRCLTSVDPIPGAADRAPRTGPPQDR